MTREVVEAEGSSLAEVASAIPASRTVAHGTRLVVFAGKRRGWLGSMLGTSRASRGVLGSALLVRGYVAIGAGIEDGRACAWGESPPGDE